MGKAETNRCLKQVRQGQRREIRKVWALFAEWETSGSSLRSERKPHFADLRLARPQGEGFVVRPQGLGLVTLLPGRSVTYTESQFSLLSVKIGP